MQFLMSNDVRILSLVFYKLKALVGFFVVFFYYYALNKMEEHVMVLLVSRQARVYILFKI